MRVWLITVGEPLPTDGGTLRLWRTGLLADALVSRGHDVVWWSSAFDHFSRRMRSPVDEPIAAGPRLAVWHLSGAAYRRNISFARLRNHRQVAKRFGDLAPGAPRPDVILSSMPTPDLCAAAVAYGRAEGVPVALDIRDLWPDVFFDMVPRGLRPIASLPMRWMRRQVQDACEGAAAILGVTDDFVHWGLSAAGRAATPRDRAFPMAYSPRVPDARALEAASDWWKARGVTGGPSQPIVSFFGTIGWMFDFSTVLRAAERLQRSLPEVTFVICGDGQNFDKLARQAARLPNVVLPGRVGSAEIWSLMRMSVAGLAPYQPFRNFDENLPNKPIEYMAGGLPTIACRVKVLAALLERHGCGLTYGHGDAAGLVSAIETVARDDSARRAMSDRASRLFQDQFTADRVYGAMAAHLETLAAAAPARVASAS